MSGNTCNKILQKATYTGVFDDCHRCVEVLARSTRNQQVLDKSASLVKQFKKLFELRSSVHDLVSHCEPIGAEEFVPIQQAIDKYMKYYREEFTPEYSVVVKQHLLEEHCVDDIRRFGMGLGILGEQGVESVHRKFKEILKRHSTLGPRKRLLKAIQEHELVTCPHLQRIKDAKRPRTH